MTEPCDGCVEKADYIARAVEVRDSSDGDGPKPPSLRKSQSLPPRAGGAGRSSLTASSPRTLGAASPGGAASERGVGGGSGGAGGGAGSSSSAIPTLVFLSFQLTLVKLARDVVCRDNLDPEEAMAALLSNEVVPVVAQLEVSDD